MKKIFLISLLVLSACQQSEPLVDEQVQSDRANSSATVSLQIGGEAADATAAEMTIENVTLEKLENEPVPNSSQIDVINGKKVITIAESGFSPDILMANTGDTLKIVNTTDKQVDLYTAMDGAENCPFLPDTIEVPGDGSLELDVQKTGRCGIINQFNTDQLITVEYR